MELFPINFRSYGTRGGSVFRYSHSKDRPLSSLPALESDAMRILRYLVSFPRVGTKRINIFIYNRCFPLKRLKAKKSTLNKPWLTKGLQKSIKKKNLLNKRFLPNPHLVLRSVIGNIEIN